jgi:hypothetical protein
MQFYLIPVYLLDRFLTKPGRAPTSERISLVVLSADGDSEEKGFDRGIPIGTLNAF